MEPSAARHRCVMIGVAILLLSCSSGSNLEERSSEFDRLFMTDATANSLNVFIAKFQARCLSHEGFHVDVSLAPDLPVGVRKSITEDMFALAPTLTYRKEFGFGAAAYGQSIRTGALREPSLVGETTTSEYRESFANCDRQLREKYSHEFASIDRIQSSLRSYRLRIVGDPEWVYLESVWSRKMKAEGYAYRHFSEPVAEYVAKAVRLANESANDAEFSELRRREVQAAVADYEARREIEPRLGEFLSSQRQDLLRRNDDEVELLANFKSIIEGDGG
jgi:hypothetical protein